MDTCTTTSMSSSSAPASLSNPELGLQDLLLMSRFLEHYSRKGLEPDEIETVGRLYGRLRRFTQHYASSLNDPHSVTHGSMGPQHLQGGSGPAAAPGPMPGPMPMPMPPPLQSTMMPPMPPLMPPMPPQHAPAHAAPFPPRPMAPGPDDGAPSHAHAHAHAPGPDGGAH